MSVEFRSERPLFGGAISTVFSQRFQEVFVDPSRDESLIFELLDFKPEVEDNGSATWFLRDLAREQDAEGFQAVSKGRQGREAQNLVRVYVANIRLKGVDTDVLVSAYEPILINPLSESAVAVGSGLAVPTLQSGMMPMSDVIKQSLSTFKVND